MDFLLNRYRNLSVLLVVVIGQLLLLAYQVKNNQDVRVLRVWAVSVVTPMARVLEFVRRNTIGIAEDYFVLVNVRDENLRLTKENGTLKLENQHLRNELSTADRMEALKAFQDKTPSRTLPARVIGNGTGANSQVVFIDRGSGSGVMRGMPVVTPDGIVGRVLASYPTASQVLLITDPTFAAGVVSQKNHVHGTLVGLGQAKCLVKYVQNEEKVDQGEMFYTSGDDRVFPKGMPVGRAAVVRQGRDFKEIYVEPSGWTSGLEEVLVVTEGVHQAIPDATAIASTDIYLQSAPPADEKAAAQDTTKEAYIPTEADRLREKYKRIGDAQNHKFGEGLPGSKPPDFNIDPDAAAKAAAARAAAAKAAAAAGAAGAAVGTAPPGQAAAPKPAPATATPAVPGPTGPKPAVAQKPNTTPAVTQPRPGTAVDANGRILQAKPVNGSGAGTATGTAPLVAKPAPKPLLDANGNPIVARPRPATPAPLDANGNPVVAKPKPRPTLDADGNPIPVAPAKPKPKPIVEGVPAGSTVTSNKTTINVVTPAQKPKPKPRVETEAPPNQ